MQIVLFVANNAETNHEMRDFVETTKNAVSKYENVSTIAPNVWQIDLEKSLEPLEKLMMLARRDSVTYALLPLQDQPKWLPATFDPKTNNNH